MITEIIRGLMKEKHVTVAQLAEHLGMKPQSLSNKFRRNSYSVNDLIVILDYLDCKLVIVPKPDYEIVLTVDKNDE